MVVSLEPSFYINRIANHRYYSVQSGLVVIRPTTCFQYVIKQALELNLLVSDALFSSPVVFLRYRRPAPIVTQVQHKSQGFPVFLPTSIRPLTQGLRTAESYCLRYICNDPRLTIEVEIWGRPYWFLSETDSIRFYCPMKSATKQTVFGQRLRAAKW